jgi:hypothetical protein
MIESYEDIAACWTYMGNVEGSSFRRDRYVQIRACGTYRRRSQPLATFLDESRVAPHVVGMLLAVAALVFRTRSVDFLLVRIRTTKVIGVLGPPLPIGLPFLLAATVRLTTGLLLLLEPRMRTKPTTTERTPPPRGQTLLLPEEKQTEGTRKEKRKSKRERPSRLIGKKERKSKRSRTNPIDNKPFFKY